MPANNTFTVYLEPFAPVLGLQYFHETLEYVNGSGVAYFVDAGPTSNPTTDSALTISQAAYQASTGSTSGDPYGSLWCASGTAGDIEAVIGTSGFEKQIDSNNASVTVSGSATQAEYDSMVGACAYINSAGLPYSPLTQNSNSVDSSVLAAGGQAPVENSIFSNNWTPAASNIIATPYNAASNDTYTSTSTSGGIVDTTVYDAENGQTSVIADSANTAYTADTMTMSLAGGAYEDSQTDSVSGGTTTTYVTGYSALDSWGYYNYTATGGGSTWTVNDTGPGMPAIDDDGGTVTVSDSSGIVLFGSGNTVNGGTGDAIYVAGQDNAVSATDSTVGYIGADNTGDSTSGSGNTANYDYQGYGYGGGYGGDGDGDGSIGGDGDGDGDGGFGDGDGFGDGF